MELHDAWVIKCVEDVYFTADGFYAARVLPKLVLIILLNCDDAAVPLRDGSMHHTKCALPNHDLNFIIF